MAAPLLAGIMAIFVGFEGLNGDAGAVYKRVKANQIENLISGIPKRKMLLLERSTPNLLSTNGMGLVGGGTPYAVQGKGVKAPLVVNDKVVNDGSATELKGLWRR